MEKCKIKIKKGRVSVTSPFEENCPEYFEKIPNYLNEFFKSLRNVYTM